jgi:hypothetical protein
MQTLNTGSENFGPDVAEMREGLQQQRSGVLDTMVDVHVGLGLLAGVEADRLAQKHGADDPRVQLLRDRSEAAAARVSALSVEQEIAAVRTPPPPDKGAVIQGRITDTMQRGAGRVIVQPIDEKGQPVAAIKPVETNDSGYFAFELTPETVKAISTRLSVLLRAADVQLVPAEVEPVAVAPGATVVMEVSLSTAELERLRLRIPVDEDTVTVKVPDADDKAATDKAVADKAAADKAAADEAEAEKAAADKAAADKAAAAKAAADKAAADKAAADKAAADKAEADKAASDKAAADKDKPTADKPDKPPAKPRGKGKS